MAIDTTVPPTNEMQPPAPTNPQVPENPAIQQQAHNKAVSLHKEKNRRGNQFVAVMPLMLNFEAATTGTISGFTPDADSIKWILGEVEIKLNGKSTEGSTVQLTMFPCLPNIA